MNAHRDDLAGTSGHQPKPTAMFSNPCGTIYHLLAARSRGDSAGTIACCEPGAAVVVESGKVETGEAAIWS